MAERVDQLVAGAAGTAGAPPDRKPGNRRTSGGSPPDKGALPAIAAVRDDGGRFAPGVSGNPATRFRPGRSGNPRGRPPGSSRFGAARLPSGAHTAAALLESHGAALAEKAIALALGGDPVAVRFCLGRLVGPRRGRPVALDDLPEIAGAGDLGAAVAAVTAALGDGRVTPDEALACGQMLDGLPRVLAAGAAARPPAEPPPVLDPQIVLMALLRHMLLDGTLPPEQAAKVRRWLVGEDSAGAEENAAP
jgi:uncharacterized protein DUF5681